MQGLRTQESKKFNAFFEAVQEAAKKKKKCFSWMQEMGTIFQMMRWKERTCLAGWFRKTRQRSSKRSLKNLKRQLTGTIFM